MSRNSAGETSTTLHLVASGRNGAGHPGDAAELRLELTPEVQVANLGATAQFHCRVASGEDSEENSPGGRTISKSQGNTVKYSFNEGGFYSPKKNVSLKKSSRKLALEADERPCF